MSVSHSGKKLSKEHKRAISSGQIGKKLTQDHKRILSSIKKGTTASIDTRKKMSDAAKGRTNSEITNKKISNSRIGMRSPNKGMVKINDGVTEKFVHLDSIPLGWKRGRLCKDALIDWHTPKENLK